MKAKPCPKCGSENLNIGDCGYSSFNAAWVRCEECKLTAEVCPGDSAVSEWNKWATNPIGMLVEQVRRRENDKRRIQKKTTTDVSEYAADLIAAREVLVTAGKEYLTNLLRTIKKRKAGRREKTGRYSNGPAQNLDTCRQKVVREIAKDLGLELPIVSIKD